MAKISRTKIRKAAIGSARLEGYKGSLKMKASAAKKDGRPRARAGGSRAASAGRQSDK